jgi:hypothetical protein
VTTHVSASVQTGEPTNLARQCDRGPGRSDSRPRLGAAPVRPDALTCVVTAPGQPLIVESHKNPVFLSKIPPHGRVTLGGRPVPSTRSRGLAMTHRRKSGRSCNVGPPGAYYFRVSRKLRSPVHDPPGRADHTSASVWQARLRGEWASVRVNLVHEQHSDVERRQNPRPARADDFPDRFRREITLSCPRSGRPRSDSFGVVMSSRERPTGQTEESNHGAVAGQDYGGRGARPGPGAAGRGWRPGDGGRRCPGCQPLRRSPRWLTSRVS